MTGDGNVVTSQTEGQATALAGSYNPVADRYLQPGATKQRPLKGRGGRVTRTIPIPCKVAAALSDHLVRFTATGGDLRHAAIGLWLNSGVLERLRIK